MLSLLLRAFNYGKRMVVSRESLPYIHLQSGAKFVHQWPLAKDVHIEDIAHNTSKLCRYAGSVEGDDVIYSVAEHCVRASYINSEKYALEKLLHDGAEFALVDCPRPFKYSPFMRSVYKFYERLAEKVVQEKFNLNSSDEAEKEVKRVDKILLVTEKRDLFSQDRVMCLNKMDDAEGVQPLPEKIVPWTPEQAKRAFLMRFYELTGEKYFYLEAMSIEDRMQMLFEMFRKFYRDCPRSITNVQTPCDLYSLPVAVWNEDKKSYVVPE